MKYTRYEGERNSYVKRSHVNYKAHQQPEKKYSGAKVVYSKAKGGYYVSAWRLSRKQGLISYFVFLHEKSRIVSSEKNEYQTCIVKMTVKDSGVTQIYPALWNTQNDKVTCNDLNLIIDPKAPKGGYAWIPKRK